MWGWTSLYRCGSDWSGWEVYSERQSRSSKEEQLLSTVGKLWNRTKPRDSRKYPLQAFELCPIGVQFNADENYNGGRGGLGESHNYLYKCGWRWLLNSVDYYLAAAHWELPSLRQVGVLPSLLVFMTFQLQLSHLACILFGWITS